MSKKILLIDDDRTTLAAIEKKLTQLGYDVVTAGDGARGLEIARREMPMLIVADFMMPNMDGGEFCRTIKGDASFNETRVILLTAKGHDDDVKELPADAILSKPCYPHELIMAMERLLNVS